jgi:hypothetical protein
MTKTITIPLCLTPANPAMNVPRENLRSDIKWIREQRAAGKPMNTFLRFAESFRHRQDAAITPTTVRAGMGATRCGWTDTHACEVVAVSKTGTRITLRRMKATIDKSKWAPDFHRGGFVGHVSNDHDQVYILEQDETAATFVATWSLKKGKYTSGSYRVYVSLHAGAEFYDNNF